MFNTARLQIKNLLDEEDEELLFPPAPILRMADEIRTQQIQDETEGTTSIKVSSAPSTVLIGEKRYEGQRMY